MTKVDLARWAARVCDDQSFLLRSDNDRLAFLTVLLQTAWYRGAPPAGQESQPKDW
jgi:hypothetical protein